jgi:hypothetical protein
MPWSALSRANPPAAEHQTPFHLVHFQAFSLAAIVQIPAFFVAAAV